MSGVARHQRPWTAHTVERRRAWHDITVLGLHARSDDLGHGMTSPPSDSTHGRQRRAWHDITAFGQHTRSTTLGVACHHCPWTAYKVGRRRTWDDIISLGQHTWSIDVGRGMTSPPLDCTHGRTTSGVTCHHRLWTAHSVERRLVWHFSIAVGQHTRSNDVGSGMISPPLECTHGRTTSGVA